MNKDEIEELKAWSKERENILPMKWEYGGTEFRLRIEKFYLQYGRVPCGPDYGTWEVFSIFYDSAGVNQQEFFTYTGEFSVVLRTFVAEVAKKHGRMPVTINILNCEMHPPKPN